MTTKNIRLMFALVRCAIKGTNLTEEEWRCFSPASVSEILETAAKHDIVHLVAFAMKKNNLLPENDEKAKKYVFNAVYRYEKLKYDYENLCSIFEKAEIPFLPLKGSVMRKFYPEAWMRTSSDMDVLVREEELERARHILVDENGYFDNNKGSHDITMKSSNGIQLDLHHTLLEEGLVGKASNILKNVWDMVEPRSESSFMYAMSDELFYFHHITHMAKHFEEGGGCGIRPLLDLWILDNLDSVNHDKRNALLAKGGLLRFAESARRLSKCWFENAEYDPISKQMESYILRGTSAGSVEVRIMLQQRKRGGRVKYAISKIFIPYDVIKYQYPILQKHRWLMPIMEVRRWGKLIFCGHLKRTTKELKFNRNITSEEAEGMRKFLDGIGL